MVTIKLTTVFAVFLATTCVTASPASTTTSAAAKLTLGPGPVCLPEGRQCNIIQPAKVCCPGLACVADPPLLFEVCKPTA
ncbi:hypothetical protein PLICRDRAFT_173608 [Plicaturopsis crispa FD-325 SS-3]|nr:hypothetical protein PLICRDRAFT_173608 [Plicaturopsis crispa FD-325 SS-3]